MNRLIKLLLLLLAVQVTLPAVGADDTLKVIALNAPPYSMLDSDGRNTGQASELVMAMLDELGLETAINTYPLKRAFFSSQYRKNVLIYPVVRNRENEARFHWIGKLSQSKSFLFRYNGNRDIQLNSLDEAKHYRIGAIGGSYVAQELKRLGFNQLQETTHGRQSMLMLRHNRIDLIATDELVLRHLIDNYNRNAKIKLEVRDFIKVLPLPDAQNEIFIALSKRSDEALKQQFQQAYDKVKSSGKHIEVAHWWTSPRDEAMLDIYRNALTTKGFKWLDYSYEGSAGRNMEEILQSRIDINNLPQVIQTYMGPAVQKWAEMERLLPLDEVALEQNWAEVLPPMIDAKIRYDGHYVAVPVNAQRVNWMWLNPAVFQQAGVDIPRSWPEFFSAADQLQEAGFIPLSIGAYPWQIGTLFESIVLSVGGADFYQQLFIDLDAELFRSETMGEVLGILRRLSQYSDMKGYKKNWVEAAQLLSDGRAGVYFMGDWAQPVLQEQGLQHGTGYLCLPVFNTENYFLLNVDAFAFPQTQFSDQAGQKALAAVIMDAEVQETFNLLKSSAPARTDITDERFDHCSKVSKKLLKQGELIPSFNFRQAQPDAIKEPVIAAVSAFFLSDQSAEETMDRLYQLTQAFKAEALLQAE